MKRILTYLFIATVSLGAASCSKWLEGTSSSQVADDKMFSSRNGFYEALTGVYISMTSESCYGRNFTFYSNELAAVNYNTVERSGFKSWQKHSYDDVTTTSTIESMWQSAYFTIANANKILSELDKRRDVVKDDWEYNMIRGEMLAVRAYIHFDLMRMFGLESWEGDNASKLTVPYVKEYSLNSTEQKSYSETKALLLEDIGAALKCLEGDPVRGSEPENFDTYFNADGFWENRNLHLNYYAVEALAARVCFWAGEYEKAKEYAEDVIENTVEKDNLVQWIDADTFVKTSSNDERDWAFTSEHLFSLEVTDLYSLTTGYCYGGDVIMTLSSTIVEDTLFPRNTLTSEGYDGAEDVRGYAMHLKYGGTGYKSYKLYSSTSMAEAYRNRMPMIRISEMYYILAFIASAEGDFDAVRSDLRSVMSHRGYTDLNYPAEDFEMPAEIVKEVCREFIGEGQLFYWAKLSQKLSYPSSASVVMTSDPSLLIYPYPTSETTYGHIQEK